MAFGGEFYNQSGKIQLGAGVSNFYMAQKGTITASDAGTRPNGDPAGYFTGTFISIAPTVAYDILAVRARGNARCATLPVFAETQAANTAYNLQVQGAGGPVDWYAFRSYKSLTPSSSGYGLEILNPDGTVGFSSKQPKILKGGKHVLASVTSAHPDSTQSIVDVALPSGRDYAFFKFGTAQPFYQHIDGLVNPTLSIQATVAWSNGNVRIRREAWEDFISSADVRPAGSGLIMVDVTGY